MGETTPLQPKDPNAEIPHEEASGKERKLFDTIIQYSLDLDGQGFSEEQPKKDKILPGNINAAIKRFLEGSQTSQENLNSGANNLDQQIEALRQIPGTEGIIEALIKISNDLRAEAERKSAEDIQFTASYREVVENTFVDPKTNLLVRTASIDAGTQALRDWLTGKEHAAPSLKNIDEIMMDMMLFHQGNEILTPDGFDNRVRTLTDGFVAMARRCAHADSLYPPFNDTDLEQDVGMQKYFPEGSQARTKLEVLKAAGVQFEPFRINAGGGDEFSFRINYGAADSEQLPLLKSLAREVIHHVITSTAIATEIDVIPEGTLPTVSDSEIEKRASKRDGFYDLIPRLEFASDDPYDTELTQFTRTLRDYLKDKSHADVILDTSVVLRMAAATTEHTMRDALYAFCKGTLSDGTPLFDKDKMPLPSFFNQDGTVNITNLNSYAQDLRRRTFQQIPEEQRDNPELIRATMESLFARDIVGNFSTIQLDEVNSEGKARKKMDVLYTAFTSRDSSAILHTTMALDRMISDLKPHHRRQLLTHVRNHYANNPDFLSWQQQRLANPNSSTI